MSLFLWGLCRTVSWTSPRGNWLGAEPLSTDHSGVVTPRDCGRIYTTQMRRIETDVLTRIKHSFREIFSKHPVSSSSRCKDANLKKQDSESALTDYIRQC